MNFKKRLVASIHTNNLRHYNNETTTTLLPDVVLDQELSQLWIAHDITIEQYCLDTIILEDEINSSDDDVCNESCQ